MLGQFAKGALATALCMSIAIACRIPLHRWAQLNVRDWVTGAAIVLVTSIVVGVVVAVGSLLRGRDRFGRPKKFDPTDIIPFI
jgi:hypothetical protein